MGEVSGSRFGSGANFPRPVTTEWECPSCGTKQVGNVAQGCSNDACSTRVRGVALPGAEEAQRVRQASQLDMDLFNLLEAHGLWVDGKHKLASGEIWDREEVKARLWPQAPPVVEDQELQPRGLALSLGTDSATDPGELLRDLTADEVRTIIAGLQLIAENFPGDNAPEGMISGNHAAALAAELTRK